MSSRLDIEWTPGLCAFCDVPLRDSKRGRKAVQCGKKPCIAAWRHEWYVKNRGGEKMREVVSRFPGGRRGLTVLTLSCGHEKRMIRSVSKRTRCLICCPKEMP